MADRFTRTCACLLFARPPIKKFVIDIAFTLFHPGTVRKFTLV